MLTVASFFDLSDFGHTALMQGQDEVWQPLNALQDYMDGFNYPPLDHPALISGAPLTRHLILHQGTVQELTDEDIDFGDTTKGKLVVRRSGDILSGATVIMAGAVLMGDRIAFGEGVLVEPGALIKSPAIIGDMTEVRQGAYLRGYCLAGKRCVLGHATEIKHSIFLNDAKAGHFAYLGDSILGNNANLGAGTKFANLRFLPGTVSFFHGGERIDTGRRKLGAILGDDCQTGCNSVTSPGTMMAKGAILIPNATAKSGYHAAKSILR